MEIPGGMGLKIEREYNSASNHQGIFGPKWGFNFDSYIVTGIDRSISKFDSVAEQMQLFSPDNFVPAEHKNSLEQFASIYGRADAFGNKSKFDDFIQKIRTDATFRTYYQAQLLDKNIIQMPNVPLRLKLSRNKGGYQEINRIHEGYELRLDDGTIERYDEKGRLRRKSNRMGQFIKLDYAPNTRRVTLIKDDRHRQLEFIYNNRSLVKEIQYSDLKDGDFKTAVYDYDENNQLVYVRDGQGNEFEYTYRPEGPAGYLTSLEYLNRDQEKRKVLVEYFKPEDGGRVVDFVKSYEFVGGNYRKIKYSREDNLSSDQNGCRSDVPAPGYDYCFTASVMRKGSGEQDFTRDKKEIYYYRIDPYGLKWIVKKEEIKSYEKIVTQFDPVFEKPTLVEIYDDEKDCTPSSWYRYKINKNGKVEGAESSSQMSFDIVYDDLGRIRELRPLTKGKSLFFRWNLVNKPTMIQNKDVGTVVIGYDDSGKKIIDIKTFPEDSNISSLVISQFQDLFSVLKYAGI